MPAHSPRVKWTKPLSQVIGYSPQRLRDSLAEDEYVVPYSPQPHKAVELLKKRKIGSPARLDKFLAEWEKKDKLNGNGNGHAMPLAPTPPTTTKPTAAPVLARPTASTASPVATNKAVVATKAAKNAKISAAANKRLLHRLAALLPQGNTLYGRQIARQMLTVNGYPRPWTDEKRALGIFVKLHIPIEKFVYENGNPIPTATVRSEENGELWMIGAAKRARTMLEQLEEHLGEEMQARRIRRVPWPFNMFWDALHELNAAPRAPRRE